MEKDSLFDKKYVCPNCKQEVKAKTVKTGKAKLEYTDPDLRPKYSNVDSLKYDGILCDSCGYASIRRYFTESLVAVQQSYITKKITSAFRPAHQEYDSYSYDEAIRRHKLAYISCLAKEAAPSELAYTSLKIAWLFRGYRESLLELGDQEEATITELQETENKYLNNAYVCFKEAYQTEEAPICGMDMATFSYLVAYLGYMQEDYAESNRWLGQAITNREASDRVKERARDLKDLLKKKLSEEESE